MEEQEIKPRGTPSKYRKEFSKLAFELALLGATDVQIAEELNVSKDTINEWKKSKKDFSDSLRRGKLQADAKVAAALYKRALGFKYNEVTYEMIGTNEELSAVSDKVIMVDIYRKKIVTKYVVPDTGAISMWLNNRQKELWRNRQEIDHTSQGESLKPEMTDAQFEMLIAELHTSAHQSKPE
jgi:transcriptional regulator with XRE-family HTH domain